MRSLTQKLPFCRCFLGAVIITLVIMAGYFFIDTRSTLWDRDEPRFARATVEMVKSGNYLFPTFNGRLRPDKPILIYWLMSLPVRLLGPTELACRFFSTVGAAITCLLTFLIGCKLFDWKAAFWAMVILATTLMMLGIGTAATADGVLLPCMVAMMAIFVHAEFSKVRIWHCIVMGIAFGAALLTKGPVGALPFAAIVTTLYIQRHRKIETVWRLRHFLIVAATGISLFLVWAIPANAATKGEFLRIGIGHHFLGRTAEPLESHGGHFLLYLPYYLFVIVGAFFPWSLHLPGALSVVIAGRVGGAYGRALLLGWIVPTVIIMTLVATKLPHYVLFIWPALAMAVGGTITASQQNLLTDRDRGWLRAGVWFFGLPAFSIAIGLIIAPLFLPLPRLQWSFPTAGMILLAMAVLAIHRQLANQPQKSAAILLAGMTIFIVPVLFGILPVIETFKISPAVAKAVKANTAADVPVATYKYGEPTLNFYIDRHIEFLKDKDAVIKWLREIRSGVLIIPQKIFYDMEKDYGRLNMEQIAAVKGFNYSKGKKLEILVLRRGRGDL